MKIKKAAPIILFPQNKYKIGQIIVFVLKIKFNQLYTCCH
jgi:hypothetical protein